MTFPSKEGAPVRKTAEFKTDTESLILPPRSTDFSRGSSVWQQPEGTRPNTPLLARCTGCREAHSSSLLQTAWLKFSSVISSAGRGLRGFSDQRIGGPYIRFAEAALGKKLGITNKGKPYSREAIARALTYVRAGRSRRREKLESLRAKRFIRTRFAQVTGPRVKSRLPPVPRRTRAQSPGLSRPQRWRTMNSPLCYSTLVLTSDLHRWVENLPAVEPKVECALSEQTRCVAR